MKVSLTGLLLACGLVFHGSLSNAVAEAPLETFPQILSYNALVSLTPEKRIAYIKALTSIVNEMEKAQSKKSTASNSEDAKSTNLVLQNLKHQIEMLSEQFPESLMSMVVPEAMAEDPLPIIPIFKPRHTGVTRPANPGGVTPPAGQPAPEGSAAPVTTETDPSKVSEYGTWTCQGNNPKIRFYAALGTCASTDYPSSDNKCEEGFAFGQVSGITGQRYCVPEASWLGLTEERRKLLASNEGAPSVASEVSGKNTPGSRAIIFGGKPTTSDEAAQQLLTRNGYRNPRGAASMRDMCKNGFVCDAVRKHRGDFINDKSLKLCINAGNITTLADSHTLGSCGTVTSFSISEGTPPIKCKDTKEILCNPLVFSVHKGSGDPFCIKPTMHATADCGAASDKDRDDNFITANIAGIKESWTKFREDFNGVCRNSVASRQFHCVECQTMQKSLAAANLMATDNSCGAVADYDTVSTRRKATK